MAPSSNSPSVRELDTHSDTTTIIIHQLISLSLCLANDNKLTFTLRDLFSGIASSLWLALENYESGKKIMSK